MSNLFFFLSPLVVVPKDTKTVDPGPLESKALGCLNGVPERLEDMML